MSADNSPEYHPWIERALFGLLAVAIGLTPFYFRFNTTELFEFNKLLVIYSVSTVLSAVWIIYRVYQEKSVYKPTIFDLPLLGFLATQLLATLFSMHFFTSLFGYYTRFHAALLPLLAYSTIYFVGTWFMRTKHVYRLLLLLLSATTLISGYAILEHLGYSISCLIAPGHNQFDATCWKQEFQVTVRAFATFGQPNWLAAFLSMVVPVGLSLVVSSTKRNRVWLFGLVSSILAGTALYFTGSRSGLLALVVGSAVFVAHLLLGLTARITVLRTAFTRLSMPLSILIVIGVLTGTPFTPPLSQVLTNPSAPADTIETAVPLVDTGGTDSGKIRKIVWEGAVAVWRRYPVFGSGLETFGYSYYRDRPVAHNQVSEWNFLYNKAHNEFLNYLATTGIVGLTGYLVLLGWTALSSSRLGWRLLGQEESALSWEAVLPSALLGASAALAVSNFFGFSTVYVTTLQFFYWACIAVIWRSTTVTQEPTNTPLITWPNSDAAATVQSLSRWLLFVGIGLLCLGILVQTRTLYQADVAYARGKSLAQSGSLVEGSQQLQRATLLRPEQAEYHDELAYTLARLAISTLETENATAAADLAAGAIGVSDTALTLNPHHLNFYKTRARIFLLLGQIDQSFLADAYDVLSAARQLAPTDPELVYNQGVIKYVEEDIDTGIALFEEAIQLKPQYYQARLRLAQLYVLDDLPDAAQAEYRYILDFISAEDTAALEGLAALETGQ